MRRVATTLAVLAILFLGTTVVNAGKPIMFTGTGGVQAPIGYCADPGFEVWEDVSWEVKIKVFFDKNGDPVRIQRHWSVEGIVYNFDDPTLFLPYKNSVYNEKYDFETEETKISGLWALVTVPGYGNVFIDVGLIIVDADFNVIFEAGKHQWWNANVEGLCQFLAPE
jgi:hypothetical protein